jgi:hypothetical protein
MGSDGLSHGKAQHRKSGQHHDRRPWRCKGGRQLMLKLVVAVHRFAESLEHECDPTASGLGDSPGRGDRPQTFCARKPGRGVEFCCSTTAECNRVCSGEQRVPERTCSRRRRTQRLARSPPGAQLAGECEGRVGDSGGSRFSLPVVSAPAVQPRPSDGDQPADQRDDEWEMRCGKRRPERDGGTEVTAPDGELA